MFCGGPQTMRAKTAEVIDSAEAGPHTRTRHHFRHPRWRSEPRVPGEKSPLTLGNIIHFTIAACFLFPVFAIIAVIWSLGDAINFIRHSVEALISSTFWLGRLTKEWMGGMYLHKNSPGMQRLIGQRKAFGAEAAKDWRDAGRALMSVGRAWSRTFGLGGLFNSLEQRVQHANQDWRRYVATQAYDNSQAPAEFPEQYVVVDELPRGGSSARLYIVRKADEPQGRLHVLKYFDLRAGGNLESVVRESQAAQLAQKLGLIVESKLGDNAFWYIMPYYSGETLTAGVMRNIKHSRDNGTLNEHYRITLGYVHQLLQIIAQYHEAGVFHKDIKPDNLIINGEKIYLVDIGLMTPLSSMAQLTTHGTEYFRDPEMVKLALEGREVRQVDAAKFDVYSIGAVLFFALSGEFPTSGALSRLPREVPTAAQWVVNRAMTGMHQRYANARAMLTDIDYLTWAASQATLEQVKPADLPSFRGMPVPSHLQPEAPQNNTEWREKLSAAPGGYGAWYAAPKFAKPKSRNTLQVVFMIVLFGLMGLFGLAMFGGMLFLGASRTPEAVIIESQPKSSLEDQLPSHASEISNVYEEIDRGFRDGVEVKETKATAVTPRVDLVPHALTMLKDPLKRYWEREVLSEFRRRDVQRIEQKYGPLKVAFFSVEAQPTEAEAARGVAESMALEARRFNIESAILNADHIAKVQGLLMYVEDPSGLHRELATLDARNGTLPTVIVGVSLDQTPDTALLRLRVIYPGKETLLVIPYAATAPD